MAAPADIWPLRVDPAGGPGNAAGIPPELQAAAFFQKTFLKILGGRPEEEWRTEIEAFASAAGNDAVTQSLRQLARVWLARAEMEQIDAVLLDYYRENVQFPDKLESVTLPEEIRRDPWGDAWSYQLHAPEGFDRQGAQRYQLGPARYPHLSGMEEAIGRRDPPAPSWKITPLQLGGRLALEFRLASGAVATIQPGGTAGDDTLVFIGQHWALMAGIDQLFATTF